MKRNNFLVAVIVLLIATSLGCKKSNNNPNYSMHAVVNNSVFSSAYCVATVHSSLLQLTGQNDNAVASPNIFIVIPNYNGVGIYPIF